MNTGLAAANSKCEINVTPLIDVLLVLLITFMVITPLMTRGLPAAVPQSEAARPVVSESFIVLQIMQDHSLRLNHRELDPNTLAAEINQIFSNRGNKSLFIEAGPSIEYREVAHLIDTVRGANPSIQAALTKSPT